MKVSSAWFIVVARVVLAKLPTYNGCNQDGWYCEEGDRTNKLTYVCQPGQNLSFNMFADDILLIVRHELKIKGCHEVNVFREYDEMYSNSELYVSFTFHDIHILQFQRSLFIRNVNSGPLYSLKMEFKNIYYISAIDIGPYTILEARIHIMFDNVTIGEIRSNEVRPEESTLVLCNSVVELIDKKGIGIENKNTLIAIENTTFKNIESKAFILSSYQVTISGCRFLHLLREQSFEIRAHIFNFSDNEVLNSASNSFNISAVYITMYNNMFDYISQGTFEEILPLNNDKFIYVFRRNSINFLGSYLSSLHHGWELDKVSELQLKIEDNQINCSFFMPDFQEVYTNKDLNASKYDFLQVLLATDSNICSNTNCTLPIHSMTKFSNYSDIIARDELNSLCSTVVLQEHCANYVLYYLFIFLLVVMLLIIVIWRYKVQVQGYVYRLNPGN